MGSHGTPFANYLIRCNLFLQLESSFSEGRCPVGAPLALLFSDSIGENTHTHEASSILGFLNPQMALCKLTLPLFPPSPSSSTPPHLVLYSMFPL